MISTVQNNWLIGWPSDEPGFVTGMSSSFRVAPSLYAMRDRSVISA